MLTELLLKIMIYVTLQSVNSKICTEHL